MRIKTKNLVTFLDTRNITMNFNEELTLNALAFSYDPDVDPTENQGLNFEWYCKQQSEVNMAMYINCYTYNSYTNLRH